MCELGWRSLGVLELTALPSLHEEHWVPVVEESVVLVVNGGDPLYRATAAPGSRGPAGEHHGRRRARGRRHASAALRDRRPDRIRVVDGAVDVVSEGHWKLFPS
jgi:hypothetical protein